MVLGNGSDMPLQWFLSDTNTEFAKQLADAIGEISEINKSSVKEIDKDGMSSFMRMLGFVKELFKEDDDASIKVEFDYGSLSFHVLVTAPEIWFISKFGDTDLFADAIRECVVFGVDPIDNETVRLDFGSDSVFRIVGGRDE